MEAQSSGRQVVLAASASSGELDHYLGLRDAWKIVRASTTSDDVDKARPVPDIFATALKTLAPLTPAEVIVVGDTPYDIEATAEWGITAIVVRSGQFSDQALNVAGSVALYDDVTALRADFDISPLNR